MLKLVPVSFLVQGDVPGDLLGMTFSVNGRTFSVVNDSDLD